jgi:hypothetical protein
MMTPKNIVIPGLDPGIHWKELNLAAVTPINATAPPPGKRA